MKISTKISVSFFLGALAIGLLAIFISYFFYSRILSSEIEMRLENIASEKKEHVQTYLNTLSTEVKSLSSSIVLQDFLAAYKLNPDACKSQFENALKRLQKTKENDSSIYDFFIMDSNGKVIISTDKYVVGADKSGESPFIGGLRGLNLTDVYSEDTLTGIPLMDVSYPIRKDHDGEVIGVLVARIKLSVLNKIMTNRISMGDTGETYLVNKYGYMITPSRTVKGTFLKQKVDTKNFKDSLSNSKPWENEFSVAHSEKVIIASDYRGNMVLGANAYIPTMQWSLLAEIDLEEAYAPLKVMVIMLSLLLFGVLSAALLIGNFVGRIISKPIIELCKGMEIVGKGNFDYKAGINTKDEIGDLSRMFNSMTSNLQKTTASLDELNRYIKISKTAEKAMKELAEQWQETFDSIHDPISIQNNNFELICVNKAYADLFKASPKELAGKKCYSIVHETDTPPANCPHVQVLKLGRVISEDVFEPRLNKWYSVSVSPLFDSSGNVTKVIHFMRDISQRKKDEEDIRNYLSKLEKMNKFMLDRELMMIQMKEKIKNMEAKSG